MINLKTMQDIDFNYLFYQNYFKWSSKKQQAKTVQKIIQRGRKLQKKMMDLTQDERLQWYETIHNKINQLFSNNKTLSLFQWVYIFVFICRSYHSTNAFIQVQYDKIEINKIIKSIYYQKYGDQILQIFKSSKFEYQEYQTWDYDDPWYTKLYRKFVD